jgi:hypothetical protein
MKRKPRKYQNKLTLYPMTFDEVVSKVLAYKPSKKKKKPRSKSRV